MVQLQSLVGMRSASESRPQTTGLLPDVKQLDSAEVPAQSSPAIPVASASETARPLGSPLSASPQSQDQPLVLASGVCAPVTEALAKIGDTRAIPPLTEALDDPSVDVRAGAVKALGRIRDNRQTTRDSRPPYQGRPRWPTMDE